MPAVNSRDLSMQSVPQQQQQQQQQQQAKVVEDLEAELASIKAEIKALSLRRQCLASALLSTPEIQSAIRRRLQDRRSQAHSDSITPIIAQLDRHAKHVESNLHRLAFSVTSFPYIDPSPSPPSSDREETGGGRLLGVRIDVPKRGGSYEKPFYIILRKVKAMKEEEVYLTVHRHTIPAFIPLKELEKKYLPLPSAVREAEEEEAPLKPSKKPRQELHTFIHMIRNALVSWHLRVDAVKLLQQQLSSASYQKLLSIEATSLEHRYLRVSWLDGRVGRVKVGERGQIERAIVIGEQGTRDKFAENAILRGKGGRIDELLSKLKET